MECKRKHLPHGLFLFYWGKPTGTDACGSEFDLAVWLSVALLGNAFRIKHFEVVRNPLYSRHSDQSRRLPVVLRTITSSINP